MRLIFLGPPGAGKGTQAERQAQKRGLAHVSTGQILREAMACDTELGKKAASHVESGGLVPDDLVVALVDQRLRADDCARGWLLDGFPRTLAQAGALDETLAENGRGVDRAVYFALDDDVVVQRLSGRRTCAGCGANFHVAMDGDLKECPRCGGEIIIREDDRPETIRERLKVYKDQTEPLVGFYRDKGLLVETDAAGTVEDVEASVNAALDAL